MTNSDLVERLEDALSLMELLEHNSFKINAFRSLIQQVEKLPAQLQTMEKSEREAIFTKTMAANIESLLSTGSFAELTELENQVPKGVRDLFLINGIGPKKIKALWKDAGIDSVQKLKEASHLGQVALLKGFGEKIQETILSGITFLEEISGKLLMHKGLALGQQIQKDLILSGIEPVEMVGDLMIASEVVSKIEFLLPKEQILSVENWLQTQSDFHLDLARSNPWKLSSIYLETQTPVIFHFAGSDDFGRQRYLLNTSQDHWQSARKAGVLLYSTWLKWNGTEESELFEKIQRPFIPVDLRVGSWEWSEGANEKLENLIQYEDLKGCIHNHSRYSDGKNTIREMADWCMAQGWSYFGIADHSKSAHYAQGMWEEKVLLQWNEVDALNAELSPFRIFKGIESDILPSGSLDYDEEILKGFDYVVASVHSGLKMDESTATQRLIKAIENPFTTILGHCSGRILLRRPGYPLNYNKIIDACIANRVAIEINAHPSRLDMDWPNLANALEKGAFVSINPDAHEKEGMDLMRYGTFMARKAGAVRSQVINSFGQGEIAAFFSKSK